MRLRLVISMTSLVLLFASVFVWYTRFLPQPYIAALSVATADYQLALAAYHNLRTIPGYGATADRLLAGVLQRRSEQAGTIPLPCRRTRRCAG